MAWSTPKTDWVSTDFINAKDYNRIANNLYYLRNDAKSLYGEIQLIEMETGKKYTDLPFVDIFNAIEQNLARINDATYDLDIGQTKTFYVNQSYIDYEELNRIESFTLTILNKLSAQRVALRHLAFTLGDDKHKCVPRIKMVKEEPVLYRLDFRIGSMKGAQF